MLNTFRPNKDGSLINADDDEVELSQDSEIRLAHAALMDADEIAAWQQHYKDYKVSVYSNSLIMYCLNWNWRIKIRLMTIWAD